MLHFLDGDFSERYKNSHTHNDNIMKHLEFWGNTGKEVTIWWRVAFKKVTILWSVTFKDFIIWYMYWSVIYTDVLGLLGLQLL